MTISGERRRCLATALGGGARAFAICDGFGAIDGSPIQDAVLHELQTILLSKARSPRFAYQLERPKAMTGLLVGAFSKLNTHLYQRSASHEDYVTCGASLTLVLLAGERAYLAHLGNTAAYLSRSGYMISLTKDDSCTFDVPVGRAVAVSAHPPILTRALGSAPHVELSVCSFRVAGDDAIVLSSKRLAGFEDRRALSAWLLHGQHPLEFADRTMAAIPVVCADDHPVHTHRYPHIAWQQVAAAVAFLAGLMLVL